MRVGIPGGGQLAQMLIQAAISLDIETVILENSPDSPAGRISRRQVIGDWRNAATLAAFAEQCDVVTLESEFVDEDILRKLEARGVAVYPTASTLAAIQDKLVQKQTFEKAGLPVAAYRAVETPRDVRSVAQEMDWPLLLKARRNGYDGYGNATLHGVEQLAKAWAHLGQNGRQLMVEDYVAFERELAVMIVRGRDGQVRSYPVVETIQRNHICHMVRAPAPISSHTARRARDLAIRAVEAVDGVGAFGVELFMVTKDLILLNEIAPRVHNSGHYTIEACVTSQFENHLRAVLGWPLGATNMITPAAVMINVLGAHHGPPNPDALKAALDVDGANIHLYGKRHVRPGRKMGHVTALAYELSTAEEIARAAVDLVDLRIPEPDG
ncbi:MAG: 5-(carboxyamino)imidazole ribonucleotide synthase [Chloroflexi bacterium]|nr:5-(carboxyamino)imidazole ribonucleotide synthase [Chloroflexota bacterium]